MERRLIIKEDLPLSLSDLEEVRRFCLKEKKEDVRVLCKGSGWLPRVLTRDWTNENIPLEIRAHKHIDAKPREWRMALQDVCIGGVMGDWARRQEKFHSVAAVVMWRAALAFSHQLYAFGVVQCHTDFKRKNTDDGKNIEIVWERPFDKEAEADLEYSATTGNPLIFPDVMLALGTSATKGIRFVKDMGARNDQITAICVSAAPEGVHNLLLAFPGIKIVVYEMGGRLDEEAYIVDTGLGDAGDKFFQAVELDDFLPIRRVFRGDWWDYLAHQIEKAHAA